VVDRPTRVEGLAPATSVVHGFSKTCAVLLSGEVWFWGLTTASSSGGIGSIYVIPNTMRVTLPPGGLRTRAILHRRACSRRGSRLASQITASFEITHTERWALGRPLRLARQRGESLPTELLVGRATARETRSEAGLSADRDVAVLSFVCGGVALRSQSSLVRQPNADRSGSVSPIVKVRFRVRAGLCAMAAAASNCASNVAQQRESPTPSSLAAPRREDAAVDAIADAQADAAALRSENDESHAFAPPDPAVELSVFARATSDRWPSTPAPRAVGSRAALASMVRSVARRRYQEMIAQLPESRARMVRQRGPLSVEQLMRAATTAHTGASAAPASSHRTPGAITHTQVARVDEGDIVKAVGNELIVLRRGHLFRVALGSNGPTLVSHVPASAPGALPAQYYDELLVDGDVALVLGYSASQSATEINRFRIEPAGRLRYVDSIYVRSRDYYSSQNYATRLAQGRLLVYMPVELNNGALGDERLQPLPEIRFGLRGGFREQVDYLRLFLLQTPTRRPTMHAVLECELRGQPMRCSTRGVIGGQYRSMFVSQTAVYLWVDRGEYDSEPDGWIFRLPLNRSTPVGAVRVQGGPVDQFAFDERDGALRVVLRQRGRGDAMWASRFSAGHVAVVRVPLSAMTGKTSVASPEAYAVLGALPQYGALVERWIGDWALFGTGAVGPNASSLAPGASRNVGTLFAFDSRNQRYFAVPLASAVERIEPLGDDALVIGSAGTSLGFSKLALGSGPPVTTAQLRLPRRAQGESRSHAFFFHQTADDDGIIGVATAAEERTGRQSLEFSSDVSFVRVGARSFAPLGTLTSRGPQAWRAPISAADWYGNSRAIFLDDRIYALMGEDIVEASRTPSGITERTRLDFTIPVR
jgi:hypothetical protein